MILVYAYWIAKAGAFHPARAHALSQVTQWQYARDFLKRNWFDKSNSETMEEQGQRLKQKMMRWEEELMELYSTPGKRDRERYIPPQPGHSMLLERHESDLETAKAVDLEWAVQPSLILQSMVEDLVAKKVDFAISRLWYSKVEAELTPIPRKEGKEEGKEGCLLLARAGLSSYLCRLCAMCVNPSMLGWYPQHHTR